MEFDSHRDFDDPKYIRWRRIVFIADKFTCRLCNKHGSGVRLEAHHIKKWANYPKLRFSISNGISLCVDCHKMIFGKEEEYESLFMRIAKMRLSDYLARIKRKKSKKIKKKVVKKKNGKKRHARLGF